MPQNSNDVVVRFIADTSNLMNGIARSEKALGLMGAGLAGAMGGLAVGIAGLAKTIGSAVANMATNATKDAVVFEAKMDNITRTMGESSKAFVDWQDTVGRSLGYSKMQSADLANTLSTNFRAIATSQEDLMNKTTKMMEASAIIRSRTGRSMNDVSERIRSAMNQEADGADELGINVRVGAIEASKAFQEMASGRHWADLNTAQQKAILYQHILNETSRIYGTEIADNTATRVAVFTASLGDLKLALGQAFLPILNYVLPILSKLVYALTTAMSYVRAFFEMLFGKPKHGGTSVKTSLQQYTQQAKAIGGASQALNKHAKATGNASKALKDAKKAQEGFLASFDEVHTVPKKADTSKGAGGGGGGGIGGGGGGLAGGGNLPFSDKTFQLPEVKLPKGLVNFWDKVKTKWEDFKYFLHNVGIAFEPVGKAMGRFEKVGKKFNKAMAGIFGEGAKIDWFSVGISFFDALASVLAVLIDTISSGVDIVLTFGEYLGALFSGDMEKAQEKAKELWKIFKDYILNVLDDLVPGTKEKFKKWYSEMTKKFDEWKDALPKKWEEIKLAILLKIAQWVVEAVQKLADLKLAWEKKHDEFKDSIVKKWQNIKDAIKNKLTEWVTDAKAKFDEVRKGWEDKADSMKTTMATKWDNIKKAIQDALKPVVKWIEDNITKPIAKLWDTLFGGIIKAIDTITQKTNKASNDAKLLSQNGYKGNSTVTTSGGKKVSIPNSGNNPLYGQVPHLASGGITNGRTMAMIGDNVGGREVVSPLSDLQSMLTNSVVTAMQFQGAGGRGSVGQGGDIVLNIDGRQFARVIKPYQNLENSRVGKNVKTQTI